MRPTTITSASVNCVIIDKRTDFPTPEPATIPTRCPRPMVRSAFTTRTPTSRGLSTGARVRGLTVCPIRGQVSLRSRFPSWSNGRPCASITRPKRLSPTSTKRPGSTASTQAPTSMRAPNSYRNNKLRPSRNPMTSASI